MSIAYSVGLSNRGNVSLKGFLSVAVVTEHAAVFQVRSAVKSVGLIMVIIKTARKQPSSTFLAFSTTSLPSLYLYLRWKLTPGHHSTRETPLRSRRPTRT